MSVFISGDGQTSFGLLTRCAIPFWEIHLMKGLFHDLNFRAFVLSHVDSVARLFSCETSASGCGTLCLRFYQRKKFVLVLWQNMRPSAVSGTGGIGPPTRL